jgi:hypothetical protein
LGYWQLSCPSCGYSEYDGLVAYSNDRFGAEYPANRNEYIHFASGTHVEKSVRLQKLITSRVLQQDGSAIHVKYTSIGA